VINYPVYDKDNFPSIQVPLGMSQDAPIVGLGYRAITGTRYFTLRLNSGTPNADDKIAALYEFWKTDCKHGTLPFLVALPFMGSTMDDSVPNFLVKFTGGLTAEFDYRWKLSQKLEVVGEVNHIGDEVLPENIEITWEQQL